MSERVEMTVEALAELFHRKDSATCWINLSSRQGVPWAIRLTFNAYTLDTRDDPELVVEEIAGATVMRICKVRVSEIFNLMPSIREIVERAKGNTVTA